MPEPEPEPGPRVSVRRRGLGISQVTLMRVLFWGALAGITLLALLPNEAVVLPVTLWDKLNHSAAFFVLLVLASLAYAQCPLWWLLLGLLAYGVLLELAQGLVGYRCASMRDVVADAAGLMAGLALLVWARSRARLRLSERQ